MAAAAGSEGSVARYVVVEDAIPAPLAGESGDVARGRALVLDRTRGNCLICHAVPEPGEPQQGEIGPPLGGVGSRLSAGQIRLRLVDQTRLNPAAIMPAYHRVEGLSRVADEYRGRPVFSAREIEDIVAYLATLKD